MDGKFPFPNSNFGIWYHLFSASGLKQSVRALKFKSTQSVSISK